MKDANYTSRLAGLRAWMKQEKVDAFLLPVTDEFQGEYSADYARRVTWLCGFDGSAGMVIVREYGAALLVDGRYTLQARQEVDTEAYAILNLSPEVAYNYLNELPDGARIALDPWLHTWAGVQQLEKKCAGKALVFVANPIDSLWKDQPPVPSSPLREHALQWAGEGRDEKLVRMAEKLRESALDALVITEPDALCWLLNIRGADVPFNPLPLAFAMLTVEGTMQVYYPHSFPLGERVSFAAREKFTSDLRELTAGGKCVGVDADKAAFQIVRELEAGALGTVKRTTNPVTLAKACKHPQELVGMREAHRRDALAWIAFLHWFEMLKPHIALNEQDVALKLEQERAKQKEYLGASFATIAGAGENGAIVHYRPDPERSRPVAQGDVVLLDAGGRYACGTTDITRILQRGIGRCPLPAGFCEQYTRVLKGHIALMTTSFPVSTTGMQLDTLARLALWQNGQDFEHGTGHGVGAALCVHEGPQRIGKRGSVELREGMILSNEPGYYHEGAYGIRIENLVEVVAVKSGWLRFVPLTQVPIETRFIVQEMLTLKEKEWLNQYHQQLCDVLLPQLPAEQAAWLSERCARIT